MRQQLESSYSKHKHRYTQYVRDYIIRILEKKHQQVNGKKLLEQYINYPQIGHHFLAKAGENGACPPNPGGSIHPLLR